VNELELRLAELSQAVDYPATPDLAPRVRARIEGGERPRRFALPRGVAPRTALAAVLGALVVALGLTMAVSPSARSAILRWLGIEGVQITRVQTLPPTRAGAELSLGLRVPEATARRRTSFRIALPDALGDPDEWHFERSIPGGAVSLVYNAGPGRPAAGPSGVSILLTEFRGQTGPFIRKMLGPGTRIRNVRVREEAGYLITGTLHAIVFQDARGQVREDRPRLAGNTVLFDRDGVTYRLEADVPGERLVALANSIR
jgi:hypothetical protein